MAGPDRRVIIITIVFCVLLLIFGAPVMLALGAGQTPATSDVILAVALAAVIVYRLLGAVRGRGGPEEEERSREEVRPQV